jgi:hypothetical protein
MRIVRQNGRMGRSKMAGEMRNLSFRRFGPSTVVRALNRQGSAVTPRPPAHIRPYS